MNEISNDEWIKELKEGDKVYVRGGGFEVKKHTLTTVLKVTPKGAIRIKSGNLFKHGHHRIDSWHSEYLVQYTPELEAKIRAEAHYNHMCYSINAQDMRDKPVDVVQRIYDILNEGSE